MKVNKLITVLQRLVNTEPELGEVDIKTKKMRVPYVGATVAFSLAFSFLLLVQYQAELGI